MRTEECLINVGAERLAATRIYAASGQAPSVISFHGHGTANGVTRACIRYLLDYLAEHGVSSACFDFSGHGESTGKLEQASLNVRKQEGQAAATTLGRQGSLAIIGTSMGGHTAALLTPLIEPRSLILFCPAAYPEDAMELKFDENFTAVARRPGAYVNSPVFQALSTFKGHLLIFAAGKDALIAKEVIDLYAESAPLAKSKKVIWLEESDHRVHVWLEQHEEERAHVLREVLAVTREEERDTREDDEALSAHHFVME
jgi:uncharacterized protein